MDKLEQYLEQVCRGIAGPRSLRQHIRQELREHLLDAVAGHRAAGLSEEESLAKALDDFGGPEQVRSEWETLHGHRLLTTVVDRALQWKEKTMKARWLWTTCAHLALAAVIAMEVFYLWWAMVFIAPSYEKVRQDGLLGVGKPDVHVIVERADRYMAAIVRTTNDIVNYWWLWVIPLVAGWVLFEWRVRSENKSLIRLSGLGLAAIVLTVGVGFVAFSLFVPYVVAVPTLYGREPERFVREDTTAVQNAIAGLEQSLTRNDWKASQQHLDDAWRAVNDLAYMGGAAPVLVSLAEQPKVDQLRTQLRSASDCVLELQNAILAKDTARLTAALKKFRDTLPPGIAAP